MSNESKAFPDADDPFCLRDKLVDLPNHGRFGIIKRKGTLELQRFYESQNKHISQLLTPLRSWEEQICDPEFLSKRKKYRRLINATVFITFLLSVAQIYAVCASGSLSLAVVTIDSIIDVAAALVMKWAGQKVRNVDANRYPCGGAKFESIGNVCYAFLMMFANLLVCIESARDLIKHQNKEQPNTTASIRITSFTLLCKFLLFVYYYPIRNETSQLRVFYDDQRNDVFIGAFGLIMFIIGAHVKWYIDSIGAIVIALIVIWNWRQVAVENFTHLAGISAVTPFLQLVTYKAMTFNEEIKKIDSCKVYHSGPNYFIELDIVMDSNTPLKKSHDVSQALQDMFESMDVVDRAFVHVDYETTHTPEHLRKRHV